MRCLPFRRFLPLALQIAGLAATTAAAQNTVQLASDPAAGGLRLDFLDTANLPWVLQSSTDLVNWTDRRAFQVRNSSFRFGIDASAAGPRVFFRLVSAPESTPLADSRAETTTLPDAPDNYAVLSLPAHLRVPAILAQDNTPATNPVTDQGATLGRVLFYDKRLSANNTVACASCHQPEHGFSDPRPFSVGFDGGLTGRNSMGLTSARYYQPGTFFWDERAATLEDQVLEPIQNEIEMGLTLPALIAKLSEETYYAQLFTAAFGDAAITSERISRALAQFVRSIVSSTTKYDVGVATGFTNFTAQENQGRQLFGTAGCVTCHGTDNFILPVARNNGLEFPYVDLGVGAITGRAGDYGKFKSPTMRNIALTAPYMHDGRFATLAQVIDFYDSGVVNNPNIAPQMLTPPGPPGSPAPTPRRLNLSAAQKSALIAFLNTLTDTTVTTDPRFSDPFKTGETLVLPASGQ